MYNTCHCRATSGFDQDIKFGKSYICTTNMLMTNNSTLKVFNNLQCCRGIAAVIVLIAHANLIIDKNLFSGIPIIGWSGVDFFFILSGFIIYYINYKYIGTPQQLRQYFSKRLLRIFPIYWFYTAGFLILNFFISKFLGKGVITWIDLDLSGLLKSFTLYPTDIDSNERPIIPVAWTLSFELIFYIIFGICIFIGNKLTKYLFAIWILFVGLSLFNVIDVSYSPILSTLCSSKNIEFIYGCGIGYLTLNNKIITKRTIAYWILFMAIGLLFLSWANELNGYAFYPRMDFLNFGIPYSIIIYALISLENSYSGRAKRTLIYLGNASYSIYLVHFIPITILNGLHKRYMDNGLLAFIIATVTTIALGCVCYSFIEKPLLKIINSRNKAKVRPATSSAAL
jgi:peptidoglycan/LPS O-acetylase OafA/YrhL